MTIQKSIYPSVEAMRDLVDAAHDALDHLDELRDAWERGAIHETDGKGGTRSNRNVEVQTKLRLSLAANGIDRATDAKLIAAAPELLEAYKMLLMLSLPQDVSGQRMVEQAKQAVVKATAN